jgi:hypothetical protein
MSILLSKTCWLLKGAKEIASSIIFLARRISMNDNNSCAESTQQTFKEFHIHPHYEAPLFCNLEAQSRGTLINVKLGSIQPKQLTFLSRLQESFLLA